MTNIHARATALLAVSAALALTLTGCASSPPPAKSATPSPCAHVKVASSAKTAGTTAFLEQAGSGKAYDLDHQLVRDAATASHDRVVVNEIGATRQYVNTVLVGTGANDLFRKKSLKCRTDAVTSTITSIDRASAPGALNPLGGLQDLGDTLNGTKSKTTNVVLFASGRNDVGPVKTTADALDHPQATINKLAAEGVLPNCKGWKGYMVTTATGVEGAKLRELYRELFQRCGGELVFWGPHLSQYPLSSGALATADTTQVRVDDNGKQATLTVSADALFKAGGRVLRDSATTVLTDIASKIESRTGTATATGFADVGRGHDDDGLGLARSSAVIGWLKEHGVPASRLNAPQSAGSSKPLFAHPATAQQHAANRRVVITIGVSK